MTGSRDSNPLALRLTVLVGVAMLVVSVTTPALLAGSASASEGIHYKTDSGLEVEDTSGGDPPTSSSGFPDANTLDLPGITLSASGSASVTLDQRQGSLTKLSGITAGSDITVNPDDKQAIVVKSDFTSLDFADANYDASNSGTDLSYDAGSSAGLTIKGTGLSSGTTVEAIDTSSGSTLNSADVDGNGAVTFSSLPSGSHDVNLEDPSTRSTGGGGGGSTQDTTDPVADAGSDRTVYVGEEVTFDGTGSTDNENVEYYAWTFDSKPDWIGATRTVSYGQPGEYTATLTVTDGAGNTDTDTVTITVEEESSAPLDATLSAESQFVSVGTTVGFDATESTGEIDSYEFTVGEDNTTASGQTTSHTFTTPGTHPVTLTVTDTDGNTDTATLDVTVSDQTPPVVQLNGPSSGPVDTPLEFDANGSTDNVNITGYQWTFGDGDEATGITQEHTYTAPGKYTVAVTATDAAGHTTTARQVVTARSPVANTSVSIQAFGQLSTNSTATSGVAIRNTGNVPLELGSATLTGDTEQFTLAQDSSALPTVTTGTTETVQVRYTPTATGRHNGTLTIPTNASTDEITVSFSGTGVDSPLLVDNSTVDLGDDLELGDSTTETIQLQNTQDEAVTVTGSFEGGNPGAYTLSDGGTITIPGQSSRNMSITYSPTTPGENPTNLRLEADNATLLSVSLSGTASGPNLSMTDTVEFGAIGKGQLTNSAVRIANTGTAPLNVTDLSVDGRDPSGFTIRNAATPILAPGERQSVDMAFRPDQAGSYNATLLVEGNDTQGPQQATLNGSGLAPLIGTSTRNLNFGNVTLNTAETRNVTITNPESSPANLTISGTEIVGRNTGAFTIERGSTAESGGVYTLTPGESWDVTVQIRPTTEGRKKAQLRVLSDARNDQQLDIWLSNTRTIIVVEEITDQTAVREPTVSVDAINVENNTELSVNVSQPSTRRETVGMDALNMTVESGGNFGMNLTHAEDPGTVGAEPYEPTGNRSVLQHIELTHSKPNEEFNDTGLVYRVKKSSLAADATPDTVTFRRYDDGDWNGHDASLMRETETHYIYSVDTPGFSQFVVAGPTGLQENETTQNQTTQNETAQNETTTETTTPSTTQSSTTDDAPGDRGTKTPTASRETDSATETGGTDGATPWVSILGLTFAGLLVVLVVFWRRDEDESAAEEAPDDETDTETNENTSDTDENSR